MRILLSLFALCVATLRSEAATVVANLVDIPGSPLNANIKLRYLGGIQGVGSQTLAGWAATVTPVNGVATFTIVTGRYQVQIGQQPFVEIFVPDTDQTYNFNDLVTKPENFNAYGQLRVDKDDSRSGYITEKFIPGTGMSFTTNTAGGVKTVTLNGSFSAANLSDRSVTDIKRKSGAVGVSASGATITFDLNGVYLQTNIDTGTKTIAFSNAPVSADEYRPHLFQFSPASSLLLTWPVGVRWIGNARTAIAGGDFALIQHEWNGTQLVLTDVTAPLLSTDIPVHTHDAIDTVSGIFDITRLPVAASGISDGTKVTRSDDARLADSRNPTGNAGGQLGGTYPNPDVRGIRETSGPTLLTFGQISDGEILARSGSSIVSRPSTDSPYTVTTSDDTATTTFTLAISANTSVRLDAWTLGAGSANSGSYYRTALFRRAGAGASLVGTNSVETVETTAGMEAGFSLSGNNAVLQVKGVAAETMNWTSRVLYSSITHGALTYFLFLPGTTEKILLPGTTDAILLPH